MTERDVDRLLQDSAMIRNRAKIQATVQTPASAMTRPLATASWSRR